MATSNRDVEFSVVNNPNAELLAELGGGLDRHAAPHVSGRGFLPLAILARDRNGQLIGGASGHVNWNWLDLELLWVASRYRRQGLGSRLLATFESQGVARGCRAAHVSTFSFQAEDFYRARGYEIFGVLDDYPPGHRRCYLQKSLIG